MPNLTQNNSKKGKAVEHLIIHELLKYDFEVFIPVLDEGIDMIIKDREGGYVDIQVKSRKSEGDFSIKDFKPSENFFIVCHNLDTNDFLVLPSKIFYKHSKKKGKQRVLPFEVIDWYKNYKNDLNLLKIALENPNNRVSLTQIEGVEKN